MKSLKQFYGAAINTGNIVNFWPHWTQDVDEIDFTIHGPGLIVAVAAALEIFLHLILKKYFNWCLIFRKQLASKRKDCSLSVFAYTGNLATCTFTLLKGFCDFSWLEISDINSDSNQESRRKK